jgi:hypothetical protein
MRRGLERHRALVAERLAALEERRAAGQDVAAEALALAAHHDRATRHFQHERLIHLVVTLFFGGILLALAAALAAVTLSPLEGPETTWLTWALAAGCLVVATLEGFYISHYYHLENGVQRLYALDLPLSDLAAPPSP